MESLFAFAIYVEHIYGINNSCKLPAFGFRFLDYPTVVINSDSGHHNSDDVKPDANGTSNDDSVDNNIDYIFNFGKGKSCLFKNSFRELDKILKEIPLYVMVFDSSDEKSRLIGCCSIPLIGLFNKLKDQIDDVGFDSPACTDQIDRFVMYNLMGVKTGGLKLQLKLNFYGAQLLKHRSRSNKVASIDTYLQLKSNVPLNEDINDEKLVVHSDERPIEIKQKKVEVEDKGIQCVEEKNKKIRKTKKVKELRNSETLDDFQDANIYCPPPLFLNLYENHSHSYEKKRSYSPVFPSRNSSCLKDTLKDSYGSAENTLSLEEPYTETLQPVDNESCVCIISDNKRKCSPADEMLMKTSKSVVANHHPSTQSDCTQHLNNVDISKLPLLSALSAEIAKLTYFISKKEGELDKPKIEMETKAEGKDRLVKRDVCISPNQSFASCHSKAHDAKVCTKDGEKCLKMKEQQQRKTVPKGKLKFKTTRTQKLRSKYVKQSKLVAKEKIPQVPEIKWDNESIETCGNDLNINTVDEVGEWMKTLQIEGTADSHVGMSPRDIHTPDPTMRKADEPSSQIAQESFRGPAATNPGFFSPSDVNKIYDPEHVETRQLSRSKKKYRSGSRGIESSHSYQSRGIQSRLESCLESRSESHLESRGTRFHNNELSTYANDTFASDEDGPGQFSDSRSTLSQTSSISLPFSGRDSETSFQQMSNVSGRSQSQASPYKHDSNASHKSRKSLHHQKNSNDSLKSLPQQSRTSDRSNKSLYRQANVSEESDKSLQENVCASNKSEQQYSHYTNASGNSLKQEDKPSLEPLNLPGKPALHSQDSNYLEKQGEEQLNASDSVERLNSSHLSSIGLERYMAADNSTDISDKHSLDVLDNSRPATQASVNTIPEDSVLSPKHVSYESPHKGNPDPDASFSPLNSIDKSSENMENSPTTPFSPDDIGVVKPNSSMYSPRKSKHNTTSFQVTKRAHGMGKLDERPESQLSSDTTLREIDKLLGEDSQLTSGSSLLMTTDETVSPIGSMNIPQKYKPLNQTTHGLNRFDKRQVDTVEEVEDNFGDSDYLPFGSMDTTPSGTMGTLPTSTLDGLPTGSMMDTLPTGPMRGTMDTLHEYETYEKPKKSDFSPHQSKQFVQRKTYENAIRENLPPFSSNTNESSLDSGF